MQQPWCVLPACPWGPAMAPVAQQAKAAAVGLAGMGCRLLALPWGQLCCLGTIQDQGWKQGNRRLSLLLLQSEEGHCFQSAALPFNERNLIKNNK